MSGLGRFPHTDRHRLRVSVRRQVLDQFNVGGPVEDPRLRTDSRHTHLGRWEGRR